MRLFPIQLCRPGMRIAKPIHNEEGLVLLREKAELTRSLIDKLAQRGIDYLYIEDEMTEDVLVPDMLNEQTRIRGLAEIRTAFKQLMNEPDNAKPVQNYAIGKQFRQLMAMILDDLSNHQQTMIMLTTIGITDNYLYQHSLNVCIYATMLGLYHGYTREELFTLGMGALLHDIGKTRIRLELLRKPGKLSESEMEEVKRHAEIGYRMLKDEPNIPLLTAHCAYQHHERNDGSGYPRGLVGSEIHDYAKWVGIVDSYDAMTTHRIYRSAMLPHEAMEALFAGAGTLYDRGKVETFRDRIALYPLGVQVVLNSGESGVVVRINPVSPQRPVVRILNGPDGEALQSPYEIDMAKRLSAMIVGIGGKTAGA